MSRLISNAGRHTARLALLVSLTACAVGPNYHRPTLAASAGVGAGADQPGLVLGSDVPADWWRVFHCADLDALVAEALKHNSTIAAAQATLRSAREQVKAQRGAYFPSVAASLEPSRQRFAPVLSSPLESGADLYTLTTTQVSVSYVPDLFGANRRAVQSLQAEEDQQRFELEAARLTLASNVVQAAIQDAALREEIAVTNAIIADQRQTLASFQRQYQLGQASKSDLALQEALLAQSEANLPPLEKQFRVNQDLLAALVGRTPAEPVTARFEFKALRLPDQLPLSLPAEIVAHRPDVQIAEAQLRAASAQVGVAAAARWPNLDITAAAGGAALSFTPAFNNANAFWSLAAGLTQPVFDGGALLHHERAAKAAYAAAAAQYQGTVVGAFQNTADVLRALASDADAERAAETSQAASRRSLQIAARQFDLGDLSRLAVLSAEQTEAQGKLAVLQAKANRYEDVVALFQALGGGWWSRSPGPPGAKPSLGD